MAYIPPKTDWVAPDGVLYTDMNRIEGNIEALASMRIIPTAGGTGTAITVDTGHFELLPGCSFSFIASANNGGAPTTINADGTGAKNLYKPNTTAAPNIISGKAYTVWYNGTHFFLKASAEGNAVAGDVLKDKTFSNDSDSGIVGTMTNNGTKSTDITEKSTVVTIQQGYHSGSGKVKIATAEQNKIIAGNIRSGVTILGQAGKSSVVDTADANAAAAEILVNKTAYVNGSKVTGTSAGCVQGVKQAQYTVQSGKTVTAGRLVGMANSYNFAMGSDVSTGMSNSHTMVFALDENRVLVTVLYDYKLSARVATVTGTSISMSGGVTTLFTGLNALGATFTQVIKFTTNKYLIVCEGRAAILTISGNSISKGTEIYLSLGIDNTGHLIRISNTKALIAADRNAYKRLNFQVIVFDGGTGLTTGTVKQLVNADTRGVALGGLNGNDVVCLTNYGGLSLYKLTVSGTDVITTGLGGTDLEITPNGLCSPIVYPEKLNVLGSSMIMGGSYKNNEFCWGMRNASQARSISHINPKQSLVVCNNGIYVSDDSISGRGFSKLANSPSGLTYAHLAYLQDGKCVMSWTYYSSSTNTPYVRVLTLSGGGVRNLEAGDDVVGIALTSGTQGQQVTIETNV